MQFRKTRIAPTPSGYLHVGNALSFLITASLAQKTGAEILLRIDDMDQARANKLFVEDIFDTLNFLEIAWQDGPRDVQAYENSWSQMRRLHLYEGALTDLRERGKIFACLCSRTQLPDCSCAEKNIDLDTPDASWRLYTDIETTLLINTVNDDLISAELPAGMNNFVVRKKDGYPAYQLTSMVDDLHFGIDLIVRGEDLWPSTIAQHYLAKNLGLNDFEKISFHHHPLIMESGEQKLSKSAGSTSIRHLRETGKTVADVYKEIEKMGDGFLPVK